MRWELPTITCMNARARWWLAVVTAAAGAFCAGFVLVPYLEYQDVGVGGLLRLAYRTGCHQIPQRCLDLGFGSMAVCARCAGLYAGGLTGLVVSAASSRYLRVQPRWLVIAVIPSAIDFAAGVLGLPHLPNWPRFAIATPVGFLCAVFLVIGIVDTVERGRIGGRRPRDPVQ